MAPMAVSPERDSQPETLASLTAKFDDTLRFYLNGTKVVLDDVDPETAAVARERYACLTPWAKDPAHYGLAALTYGHAKCEDAVLEMLREMMEKRVELAGRRGRRDAERRVQR